MKERQRQNNFDRTFVRTVRTYFRKHGRHDLPWRTLPQSLSANERAYRILVSEIMLQQTQVPRVREKYRAFLRAFPSVRALAGAPLGDVLRAWQGLGYNRRAKLLHRCAQVIADTHRNAFPNTFEVLILLPGVGPYTAGAIMAFAYNEPVVMIETNIRTVYLFHYFDGKTDVSDKEVLAHVARTSDLRNPREWYAALMDYGTFLKQTYGSHNARSRHYTRQSAFKGSDREIRGAIMRTLAQNGPHTTQKLIKELSSFDGVRIKEQLFKLFAEGLVTKTGHRYTLPS